MQDISLRNTTIERLRQYQSLKLAFRVFRELRTTYHLTRNRLSSIARGQIRTNRMLDYSQSLPQYTLPVNGFSTHSEFSRLLRDCGIRSDEGAHAIYLRPQPGLDAVLGEVVKKYPPDAGFKILKNFQPPDKVSYIRNAHARPVTRLMMGSVQNQALAANSLYCLNLGPRCYGIAHLQVGGLDMTAFVIQHVEGETPSLDESTRFLSRMEEAVKQGMIQIVPKSAFEDLDFRAPDCNGNLIREHSTGKLQYVDFQRFVAQPRLLLNKLATESAESLHFGGISRLFRGGKRYLYQSIPGLGANGKRDTTYRWDLFQRALNDHGVSCEGRVVLDICCNSGMMLSQALRAGADWGLGWDLPGVVERSEKIMSAIGASRGSLVPAHLGPEYQIADSIPSWIRSQLQGSLVFYLAAVQHIGVIQDLANIPWKALLFEGHQDEGDRETDNYLKEMESTWNCRVAYRGRLSDGDCSARVFALLLRDS